jgi:hypothetical protein
MRRKDLVSVARDGTAGRDNPGAASAIAMSDAPGLRDPIKAKDVARRLTLKAASRLRRMEYYSGAMSFSARL